MSNTDGPAALRRLAEYVALNRAMFSKPTIDDKELFTLAAAWDAEREQAAADRDDCATFAGQNEQLIKATGTETFSAALQRISVCAADRAALAQARALLEDFASLVFQTCPQIRDDGTETAITGEWLSVPKAFWALAEKAALLGQGGAR